MHVAVTGGTGFVGSFAVEALQAAGHRVRLIARNPGRVPEVLSRRDVDLEACEIANADMADADAVGIALDGCDALLHAAAAIGVTSGDADAIVKANVEGCRNVVGQGVAAGLDPVIHVSTIGCFVPSPDPVITPASPLASPRNAYGRSKIEAERYVRGLQDGGAPVTIVYPGGIFGPDQPTLDAGMEGIVGALEQAFPMPSTGGVGIIDVRDLAQILARAVEPGRGGRRLMAGGRFHTWPMFAALCDDLTGVKSRKMRVPPSVIQGIGWAVDVAKRVGRFDYPLTRDAAEFMVKSAPTDDEPTLDELGVTYRPSRQTITDAIRWLAAEGHLSARAAGRLASDSVEI